MSQKSRKNRPHHATPGIVPVIKPAYITKTQLVEMNDEAIRQDHSRTLWPDIIRQLPDLRFPITAAFRHTAWVDPRQQNYRLGIALCRALPEEATEDDMEMVQLDVTDAAYELLKENSHEA